MKLNLLITLLLILSLTSKTTQAQTVCTQKIEIKDVKKAGDKSSFELKLSSNEAFTGKLVEITPSDPVEIQTFNGQGNLKKTFINLKESQYRIILEFRNETKFLCKQKIFSIDLTDNK
jgi:hypothetical protein